ncbi:G-protein coupled receptor GRL101-like protein [Trichoplax sp. H2]|nr:G-protein coupled receptor GRL101-like protein [Trichoplax sp. H2]|eukprot:RDD47553.1 G-protein coupled receptor GRL101-like protein [Trichoplax sp. H2]
MPSLLQNNPVARILAWTFGIMGILGNLTILWHQHKCKLLKIRAHNSSNTHQQHATRKTSLVTRYLICNLAIADLLGSIYLIIIASADVYYGYHYPNVFRNPNRGNVTNPWLLSPFCHLSRFIFFLSSIMSIALTFVIAVDRFIAVIFPYSKFRFDLYRCRIITTACWFIVICYALIPTIRHLIYRITKGFDSNSNLCLYRDVVRKHTFNFIRSRQIIYFILTGAIIVLYNAIIIYVKLKSSNMRSQLNKVEKKIFLVMLFITISNIFTLLPTFLVMIFSNNREFNISIQSFQLMLPIFIFAIYFSAAINPIIYFVFTNSSKYKAILSSCFKTQKETTIPLNTHCSTLQKSNFVDS